MVEEIVIEVGSLYSTLHQRFSDQVGDEYDERARQQFEEFIHQFNQEFERSMEQKQQEIEENIEGDKEQ
jgi:F0F1-type ATP synthase membrane subunit b/b'